MEAIKCKVRGIKVIRLLRDGMNYQVSVMSLCNNRQLSVIDYYNFDAACAGYDLALYG